MNSTNAEPNWALMRERISLHSYSVKSFSCSIWRNDPCARCRNHIISHRKSVLWAHFLLFVDSGKYLTPENCHWMHNKVIIWKAPKNLNRSEVWLPTVTALTGRGLSLTRRRLPLWSGWAQGTMQHLKRVRHQTAHPQDPQHNQLELKIFSLNTSLYWNPLFYSLYSYPCK